MTAAVVSAGQSCAYSSRLVASSSTAIRVCRSAGRRASQTCGLPSRCRSSPRQRRGSRYYVDNGPSFQATRFHAACDALGIRLVHSTPYHSECRGVIERLNRTVKEQFETEVRGREEPLTLDELNAYFEAWLAERYHRDVHSETGETPATSRPPNSSFPSPPALSRYWLAATT
jgi:transposase InsO family protein